MYLKDKIRNGACLGAVWMKVCDGVDGGGVGVWCTRRGALRVGVVVVLSRVGMVLVVLVDLWVGVVVLVLRVEVVPLVLVNLWSFLGDQG